MGQYVDFIKRSLEAKGLRFDGKKHKLVKNGLFELSASRALNYSERKQTLEEMPLFTQGDLDKTRVLCVVLIKSNKKADKEELLFWNGRYQNAIAPPEMYFVSCEGFEKSAVKYAQRYLNITLVQGSKKIRQ
jgi:hypothetical protein